MSALPFPFPVVRWDAGDVVLIDQTLLPGRLEFRRCHTVAQLCVAIGELAVRGAPAIGVAAGYGLVLSWRRGMDEGLSPAECEAKLERDRRALAATRPTAVNLVWALDRVLARTEPLRADAQTEQVLAALLGEAAAILEEDIAMCRALGRAGQELLPQKGTVLTHCNAGGLATGGYGTAVGVIYAAREAGKEIAVFADETRPLLQGARLTAWELLSQGVPVTVLCEGAAASALRQGLIDAVITGADRIAVNGDAANKIGTYPLAVLAARHAVPFYVAAPASTFDPKALTGDDIPIEMRDPQEVCSWLNVRSVPEGADAWNPAFDVTPADLITAFITEYGVLKPPFPTGLLEG